MKKKILSVTVPFKESEKWMYDIISTHSSKSAYIKDILAKSLKSERKKEEDKKMNLYVDY